MQWRDENTGPEPGTAGCRGGQGQGDQRVGDAAVLIGPGQPRDPVKPLGGRLGKQNPLEHPQTLVPDRFRGPCHVCHVAAEVVLLHLRKAKTERDRHRCVSLIFGALGNYLIPGLM